jgi:hypothetical protein
LETLCLFFAKAISSDFADALPNGIDKEGTSNILLSTSAVGVMEAQKDTSPRKAGVFIKGVEVIEKILLLNHSSLVLALFLLMVGIDLF